MVGDDYTSLPGGGLRLKGDKVKKKHKKKKDKPSDLEKNLSTGETSSSTAERKGGVEGRDDVVARRREDQGDHDAPAAETEETDEPAPVRVKTEAERRFEEARRKKLLELAESASARPELLKTHKERVEELNTYLSKLSEHHDMPKIGPG